MAVHIESNLVQNKSLLSDKLVLFAIEPYLLFIFAI